MQVIHMKCQVLFSLKNRIKKSKCRLPAAEDILNFLVQSYFIYLFFSFT